MKRAKLLTIILMILFVSVRCQKKSDNTSTGNPLVSLAIAGSGNAATAQLQKKNPWDWFFNTAYALPPPILLDSGSRVVTLQQFWLSITDFEFKASETPFGQEESEVQLSGPFVIDMLTSSPSSLGQVNMPASGLRRIKAKLQKSSSLPTGAPTEMSTNSVAIMGSIAGHTFSVLLADGIEYEVAGPNALSLQSGENLLISFQTANLIKKMDLSAISSNVVIDANNRLPATNPCPSIDPSAADIYSCFRSGLISEANIGHDASGNGDIDAGESTVK